LLSYLAHPDDGVVAAAADALGHIGNIAGDTARLLASILQDPVRPPWVRDTCAYGLGFLKVGHSGNAFIKGVLEQATQDRSATVAARSRESLTRLGWT
jgi:HEAT repeat protein